MFTKLKSVLNYGRQNKSKGVTWQDGVRPGCGATGFLGCNTQSYDNTFPNITRIAEAFAEVKPYAVDQKGKKLSKQPRFISALFNPNEQMSESDFMETLIVMLLVHPVVYILCWHYEGKEVRPGGPITKDNIAGFTFLQGIGVSKVGGITTYLDGSNTWTTKDVIALSLNVNPYNILAGYSPTQAIKKWATVDDYIAEYQAGVFRNGAIPAGQMTITAPTVEEYNKTVDALQAHHRGAGNANNIVYSHRPTSSIDGKPMASNLEWTPYAQSNKDMTLDSLFNQANKKIDMNFGVPEEVKGYLQNSNYASAEVADYVFARRVVYPKLVKIYSKLTHEFSRIVGGNLGFSLSFDYEPPVLTDSRKVQAETLNLMLSQGFTVESAVEALQLPRSFLKLTAGAPPVDDNLEAQDSRAEKPVQSDLIGKHPRCDKHKSISTWDFKTNPTLQALVDSYNTWSINMFIQKWQDEKTTPYQAYNQAKSIVEGESGNIYRTIIIGTLYYLLSVSDSESVRQFAANLGITEPVKVLTEDQLTNLNYAIQTANSNLATYADSITIPATIIAPEVTTAIVDVDTIIDNIGDMDRYHEHLNDLLISFAVQSLDEAKAIAVANESREVIHGQLLALASASSYRVERWSTSEQHRAEEYGTLTAAKQQGDAVDLIPVKTWHISPASPDVCVDCIAMNGQTVDVEKAFSNGEMVPHYHPHCYCTMSIEFEEKVKSVKVCCPHCKRYMFESTGGVMKNVICANSKCKKHFDIEVNQGEVVSRERLAENG